MLETMTARDAHACHELAGRCRECGADADGWREVLMDGMRALVGAQVVIAAELENFGAGVHEESRSIQTSRSGWADEAAAKRWGEYAGTPVERTPEFPSLSGYAGERLTISRDQIWGRETWYRSKTYNEIHRACGIDDYVMSLRRTPIPGRTLSLWLHRGVGTKEFTDRERAMIGLVHDTVGSELGGFLAAADEPRLVRLTERRREVLAMLLDGDSEKQVAFRLGLGRATVHDHVLALYRHFGVSSRGELLARFIGRARPDLS